MKPVIAIVLAVLAAAAIGLGAYNVMSTASLRDDLNDEVTSVKRQNAAALAAIRSDVENVSGDVGQLEEVASRQERVENLAADAKKRVEKGIRKDRLIELQQDWQVGSWSVGCVVATSNTLDCIGEGFLDGEESKESYEVTVDEDGSFVWKQTY